MHHDNGKIYISKNVIIDTQESDVIHLDTIIQSINEVFAIGGSSSPIVLDTTKLESIVTLGIIVGSSTSKKQFIMFEETTNMEFIAYAKRQQTLVK